MKNNNRNEINDGDVKLLRIYERNMELLVKTTRFFNDTEGKSIHPLAHILLEKVADGCWNYLIALKNENYGNSFNNFMKAKNSISESIPVIDIFLLIFVDFNILIEYEIREQYE